MNEMGPRFQELAEQAGIDFFNSTDPEYCGREYCEAWTEQQQKFAELIVQESIEVMKRHDYHGEWLGKKIREHFGLE